jgi:gamma-glutamyltranspeptidase/glutathione hydrolase
MRPARRWSWLIVAALTPLGCAARTPGAEDVEVTGTEGSAGPPAEWPAEWRFRWDAPATTARAGMVVSTDSLASAAGLEILRAGGNAVDAAIATQFALAVVNPQAGNIGGGGFMIGRLADDTRFALDFREEAPGGSTADMYVGEDGTLTDDGWTGHLASGVPGSVAGMSTAYDRYGTLPWDRLLEPAIKLARDGFMVQTRLHQAIENKSEDFRRFESSAAVFLPGGEPPPVGSVFRQPDLARSLEAIADSGARVFYRGWIADSIAAEMRRGGGLIGRADLAAYVARWRAPVQIEYRDYEVISMPPPSSGGVTMGEILNIVENFDLAAMGWHTTDAVHVAAEAMRRAYGDRNFYLGDPDHVDMPLERLLSQAYADSLAATIDLASVSSSETFNRVPVESTETTHFSVVDVDGNAIAVTTTLNGGFGSKVVVRGAGFLLNNEMDDFTSKPGIPNAYGLVQGEANAIEPGKRMLSAMTPTIVIGPEGRTELITGTPGGATIITTVFQIVSNYVDFGLSVAASVNAPRFHHQNLPDRIYYERNGLTPETVVGLEAIGHEVYERNGTSGDVESIYIDATGVRYGAADPRLGGMTLGY